MTTIAYKDGIIAYDSRCIDSDGVIVDDDYDKRLSFRNLNFFFSGSPSQFDEFVELYNNRSSRSQVLNATCFVVDDGSLFLSSMRQSGDEWIVWKEKLRFGNPCAIGSGERFALVHMDHGLTAEEAVMETMKRDSNSGGRVRTFSVADGR